MSRERASCWQAVTRYRKAAALGDKDAKEALRRIEGNK
jgi:hypothetical protein